jgi:enoyl-CoA hydratase
MASIDPSNYEGLILTKRDRILYAELNNPSRKNALTTRMLEDLHRLWREVDEDEDVHVVVLSGKGEAFCAGIDLNTVAQSSGEARKSKRLSVRSPRETFWGMLDCETPIISKVRGPAYGLGVNICLSADIVVAADTARFCDSHVKNGIAPGDGGAALWPLLVGFHRAKEFIMLGDPVPATRAAEIGLINYAVADEELDAFVDNLAERLANGAPLAIAFAKLSVNVMLKQLMAGAFETSMAYDMLTLRTDDVKEGSTAFVEKRKPNFTGL